jgi:hypothetical protein
MSDLHTQLSAYFFPVLFAIPLFGGYLAKQWLWYFTPSLSYIGQGAMLLCYHQCRSLSGISGIIMGFPTTVSMNLVSVCRALLSRISPLY